MQRLLKHLETQLKLSTELWEKIKVDWASPNVTEKLIFLDDKKHVIVCKIENEYALFGFQHFEYLTEENDLIYASFINQMNKLVEHLKELLRTYKITSFKCLLITSYRLSSYPDFPLTELPLNIGSYLYMNEYPNFDKRNFKIKLDEEIFNLQKAKRFLNYFNSKKFKEVTEQSWTCSICDGDETTGCQLPDTDSCPH